MRRVSEETRGASEEPRRVDDDDDEGVIRTRAYWRMSVSVTGVGVALTIERTEATVVAARANFMVKRVV